MSDNAAFTTFLIHNGEPIWIDSHLERVRSFCQMWGCLFDEVEILSRLNEKIKTLKGLFRGRIIVHAEGCGFSITVDPFVPDYSDLSLRLLYVDRPLGETKVWPFRNLGVEEGEELILVDGERGDLLEGNCTNLFVWRDGTFYTPSADGRILAGVCRAKFIRLLRMRGYEVVEGPLSVDFLRLGEIFLTNSLRGVRRGRF